MGNALVDGTLVAGIGIAVVFATLTVLMAVILLMGRFFPEKGREPVTAVEAMEPTVSAEGEGPAEGEVVAAIALALSLAESESGRPVPTKAAPPRQSSRWATYGRQQLMNSRGRKRKQW